MTARKAAHSLQRAKGALASGFATVDLHHATGHDPEVCGLLSLLSKQTAEPARVFGHSGCASAEDCLSAQALHDRFGG